MKVCENCGWRTGSNDQLGVTWCNLKEEMTTLDSPGCSKFDEHPHREVLWVSYDEIGLKNSAEPPYGRELAVYENKPILTSGIGYYHDERSPRGEALSACHFNMSDDKDNSSYELGEFIMKLLPLDFLSGTNNLLRITIERVNQR